MAAGLEPGTFGFRAQVANHQENGSQQGTTCSKLTRHTLKMV